MFCCGKEPSYNSLVLAGKHKALLMLINKALKHLSIEELLQAFHKGTTVSEFKLNLTELCCNDLSRSLQKLPLH